MVGDTSQQQLFPFQDRVRVAKREAPSSLLAVHVQQAGHEQHFVRIMTSQVNGRVLCRRSGRACEPKLVACRRRLYRAVRGESIRVVAHGSEAKAQVNGAKKCVQRLLQSEYLLAYIDIAIVCYTPPHLLAEHHNELLRGM